MKFTAINQQRQRIEFAATLAGFTAAYDGPALDAAAVKAQNESLQQKLQRRAEEQRKRLLEQQGSENAGQ